MNIAIILAAGCSARFGNSSKITTKINKKQMFLYSLNTCLLIKQINKIILVVNKKDYKQIKKQTTNKIEIIIGSEISRNKSLEKAIKQTKINKNDTIITLDGARPFVNKETITKSIELTKKYGFCSAFINIYDSVYNQKTKKYEKRDDLIRIQTPQTIKYKYLKNKKLKGTDLFDSIGIKLNKKNLFLGDEINFKITTKKELEVIKQLNKIK